MAGGWGGGALRIPSDGDDWIGAKINRSQQEPVGHGLLTPKSPMQNIQALNLSSIIWCNTTNKNKRKKIRKTPQARHKSLIPPPPPPSPKKCFSCSYLKNPGIEIFKPQNILRSSLEIRSTRWSCIDVFLHCVQQNHKYFCISPRSSILIFSFDLQMAMYYSYVSVTSYMKVNTE